MVFAKFLVNPYVFRPTVGGDVVAMLMAQVSGITIAATKEITVSVVAEVNQMFS